MSESNMNYNEHQDTAVMKKKGGGAVRAGVIIIAVGLILFILGYVMYLNSDKSKYINVKDISEGFDGSQVKDIELDIGWGNLIVEKSTNGDIFIDAKDVPEGYDVGIKGDKFVIKYNEKNGINIEKLVNLMSKKDCEPTVKLMLPEKEYDRFLLNVGAGDANVSGISCSSFTLDCGAGDVDLSDIISADRIDINGGAGDINVRNTSAGGLDIDIGAGDFDFAGTVNGNIDVDCGVGDVTFRLTNPAEDFENGGKYTLSCDKGVGSIDILYNVK